VISLTVASHKLLLDVEMDKLKEFQFNMLKFFADVYPEIIREIEEKKVMSDELEEQIQKAAQEFKSR